MTNDSFHLFEVIGVELEYMIVDRDTLDVRPICDELLISESGEVVSDIERGPITWSNELASHVIELKTSRPVENLDQVANQFQSEVLEIQSRLRPMNACLLPTAMHPWMNPFTEMRVWPHEYSPVYDAYNRIFDCRGHGWANLQSMHLNFPFANDEEFAQLHAAIRVVLPLLPAIAASSPIIDGVLSEFADHRLHAYRNNSSRIPEIAGLIIPEPVTSQHDYEQQIFAPMYKAIAPFDPEGLLQDEFLNSRGAIARFDRHAIEIRLLDLQECPANDIAIAEAILSLVKCLCGSAWSSTRDQNEVSTTELAKLLNLTIRHSEMATIDHSDFLKLFGIKDSSLTAKEVWKRLLPELDLSTENRLRLNTICDEGSLSTRIRQDLTGHIDRNQIVHTYQKLSDCLNTGTTFRSSRASS
jgi:gamma-glutamyl:cysteine ligase YbdK (ATP-grasp superfamily)